MPEPTPNSVGETVRLARREAGLSQRRLGVAVGIRHATISNIELGKTQPRLTTLMAIGAALEIPWIDLLKNSTMSGDE